MSLRRALDRLAILAASVAVFAGAPAPAASSGAPETSREPAALIIFGGGWGAEGTQASIEAHVASLARVLAKRNPRLLFASGDPKSRDVQIAAKKADDAGEILGLIFDRPENVDVAYRPTELGPHGAASKNGLIDALAETRSERRGTIVLGVGHGTAATTNIPATLELWGPDDRLAVDDLAKYFDGHARKSAIAFVLGQCHSGAFTDLAYEEGDSKLPLAEPVRCVLAAVPGDREAAGCTPDLGDPDARSYIAMIAEALEKKDASDFDHDGRVTLAEAHAYARIQDRTVDVPVSTSEAWLKKTLGAKAPKPASIALNKLLEHARPAERAVIDALRSHADVYSVKNAANDLEAMQDKLDRLDDELDELDEDRDRIRRRILDAVLTKWPELASPYHAEARRLLSGNAREVVELVRSKKELGELEERELSIREKEREKLDVEKKKARLERWLNAVEALAAEDALRKSGNKKWIEALDRIQACESLEP